MQLTYEPVSSMPRRNAALKIYRGALDYFRETNQPLPTSGTVQTDRHRMPENDSMQDKHYELIVVGGKPIGVVDVVCNDPDTNTITLQLLLVTRTARHHGYGEAVVAHLRKVFGGRSWRWLQVVVVNADPKRLAFWENQGFDVVSQRRVALASGDWQKRTVLRLAL
ncbi:GNAT family N-acetyltransferase [Lacticaseibacillus sp. GG6-2]